VIVPRADWDRPPFNRWSFQHIREILPTVEVWRGDGPVRVLPRKKHALDGLKLNGGTTLLQFLDDTYTDGFLVIHDCAIVHERYLDDMTPRTLHLSQSMSKSITGMTAGILVGRGLIDPAKPVTHYLPELEQTAWRGATLQQVLDMTTGVVFSEEYTDPYSDVGQVDVASGWKPVPPGADPNFKWPAHVWDLILGLKKVERPHGMQFVYRSIETDVLAFVMERVSGLRLPQLISEFLWQKLGVEESANFTVDLAGYALAEGGFNACLRDYGRFGLTVLNDGDGIIPANWIDASRNGDQSVFTYPFNVTLPHGAYRNCMWIEDPGSRSLLARGVFGQMIYMNWDMKLVIVKLSSWPDFLNAKRFISTLNAFHAIGRALN
jgi:CubicO group peptidase (beta-lactamase class C family)